MLNVPQKESVHCLSSSVRPTVLNSVTLCLLQAQSRPMQADITADVSGCMDDMEWLQFRASLCLPELQTAASLYKHHSNNYTRHQITNYTSADH